MSVFDVSGIASRRREVWRGGIALKTTVLLLGWGATGQWLPGAVSPAVSLAVWPLLVLVVFKVVRPLRSGQLVAARAVVVLTVALGVLQLVLLARFVGRSGQASWFTAVVVVAVAWSVRAQAGAARAVVGSRTTWLDTALLRVAIPVLGAGAILVVAAAAIAHVDLLARVASEPPAVQWSVLLLALAGYLDVRAIAGALSRTPEPDESRGAEDLVQTWEVPSKRTQFMFGTGVGAVIGVASVLMPAVPLVTLAALAGTLGPISLPLLVVGGRLSWRFYTYSIRFFGRMQVGARKRTSIVSRQSRRPDVLYLRSFPTDRWRVSAEAIRHPAGRFGRPPFEEVVLRRLWQYGTVLAAEHPGAFAEFTGPIGASKSRLAAESWHITLVQWMRDAQLVVAVAGGTTGLLWELEQLKRLGLQDKLFFAIPPAQRRIWWRRRKGVQEIARHWDAACRTVAEVGGLSVPSTIDAARTRAVVPGLGDAEADLVVSDGDRDFDYEAAVELAATITLARQRQRSSRDTPSSDGEPSPAQPSSLAGQMRPSPTRQPGTWEQGAVPGWYSDPGGRHELRYWDGLRWTEHAFDRGTQAVDPVVDSRSSERTPKAT